LVHCATYKNNNEGLTRFFPWLHKLARDGRSTTAKKKKKKKFTTTTTTILFELILI
jgi:hypothetical protein